MADEDSLAIPKFQLNAVSTLANLQLAAWKAAADAKLTLAKADLTTAQARLVDAATEDLKAQVELKRLAVQRYDKELHDLAVEEHQAEVRGKLIDSRARDMRLFYRFQHLSPDAVPSVWVGFRFFLTLSPIVGGIANSTPISAASRSATGYSYNRNPSVQCQDLSNQEQTLTDLIEWLAKRSYMPRSGSSAAAQLAALGVEFDKAAQATIETLEGHVAKLRKGTFDAWPPMQIAALPLSPAAARAIQPPVG